MFVVSLVDNELCYVHYEQDEYYWDSICLWFSYDSHIYDQQSELKYHIAYNYKTIMCNDGITPKNFGANYKEELKKLVIKHTKEQIFS